MKLKISQRWLCKKNPANVIVEILEVYSIDSALGLVLQSKDPSYPLGKETTWWKFPTADDVSSNDFWEYLIGQDKPT